MRLTHASPGIELIELNELYLKYGSSGLEILGFPCNQVSEN
jgi:glutathione peroxidase-family protein